MDNRATAKKIAQGAIVLLKNDGNLLPFTNGDRAAFFGRSQINTIYSGNGSGAAHKSGCKNILEECEKKGICAEHGLKTYYTERISKEEKTKADEFDWADIGKVITSGAMYEIFGKYHAPTEEYEIPGELIKTARQYTDTAVFVLGRNSGGEECDRHLQGDYFLTDSEKALVEQVCGTFDQVVLILNVNGLTDLSWTENYPSIKSILFAGILGEEGAAALADLLTGTVSPSGKLAFTIARQYEDYPAARHFTWDKEAEESLLTYESYGLNAEENGSIGYAKSPVTVYWEDLYAGYRYFDTFGKEPLYPFGHGLSYTEFETECTGAVKTKDGVEVQICVRNTGNAAGREVVQLYLADCDSTERAFQELKGFEKTGLLQPGEEENIRLFVPWKEWSCYNEKRAAYVIRQGDYQILTGNSSRNTRCAAAVRVMQDILIEQCANRLGIQECNRKKLEFLTGSGRNAERNVPDGDFAEILVGEEDVTAAGSNGISMESDGRREKVKKLSVKQLAALCVGYGPGTPFAAFREGDDPETIYDEEGKPITTNSHSAGYNGYVSPAIEDGDLFGIV